MLFYDANGLHLSAYTSFMGGDLNWGFKILFVELSSR